MPTAYETISLRADVRSADALEACAVQLKRIADVLEEQTKKGGGLDMRQLADALGARQR
jgi:hypothetical protein